MAAGAGRTGSGTGAIDIRPGGASERRLLALRLMSARFSSSRTRSGIGGGMSSADIGRSIRTHRIRACRTRGVIIGAGIRCRVDRTSGTRAVISGARMGSR